MYIYKFKEVEKAKFTEGLEDFQVCQRVNRETLSTKSTLDKRSHHCTMCTFTSLKLPVCLSSSRHPPLSLLSFSLSLENVLDFNCSPT